MGKILAKGAGLAAKLLILLSFWHPVCIYLYHEYNFWQTNQLMNKSTKLNVTPSAACASLCHHKATIL